MNKLLDSFVTKAKRIRFGTGDHQLLVGRIGEKRGEIFHQTNRIHALVQTAKVAGEKDMMSISLNALGSLAGP